MSIAEASTVALFVEWVFEHLGLPLIVGGFAAWVVAWLALRRFRSERWWEKKCEAYSDVIGALHHIKQFAEAVKRRIESGQPPNDSDRERGDKLHKRCQEAFERMHEAADTKKFLLSKKAGKALSDMHDELDQASQEALKGGDFDARVWADAVIEAMQKYLDRLPDLGKQDLRVR